MVLDLSEALDLGRKDANQLLYAAEYPLELDTQESDDAFLPSALFGSVPEEEPAEVEKGVFVARQDELNLLSQFFTDVLKDQQGRVIFINGDAGSGKTALVEEFCWRSLEINKELVVAGGSCNAYIGISDPYLPFREILALLTYDMEVRWAADVALGREGERHPLEPVVNEFQLDFGHNRIDLKQTMGKHFVEAFLDTEPNRLGVEFQSALYEHTRGHALNFIDPEKLRNYHFPFKAHLGFTLQFLGQEPLSDIKMA